MAPREWQLCQRCTALMVARLTANPIRVGNAASETEEQP
ncbi:hypothetical protein chiPu_0031569, partial [Chiloscyllium punctatum]|nr:hypothetical protein [Chiloscyllium punctatum]